MKDYGQVELQCQVELAAQRTALFFNVFLVPIEVEPNLANAIEFLFAANFLLNNGYLRLPIFNLVDLSLVEPRQ